MNASEYLVALNKALGQIDLEALGEVCTEIQQVKAWGGILYLLGNGGSQTNASHLVLHLINLGYKAHDLMSETAWVTACANDHSWQSTPARRLSLVGRSGDALLVFSGSGNSPNVLNALQEAKRKGMVTMGLLGFGGGFALQFCEYAVVLAQKDYGICEDAHSAIVHILANSLVNWGKYQDPKKQGIALAK